MKTRSRLVEYHLFKSGTAALALGLAAGLLTPAAVRADGCFVMPPFVWNKSKDINEPTQKAVLLHDAGREDLILQVKYDGPVEEFGWLVPVPGLPKVEKASMDCFYELSRYTQEHLEPRYNHAKGATLGIEDGGEKPEPVKVIEIKTVGAYEVAVLAAQDAGALRDWLKAHGLALPEDPAGVIESYAKRQWYFVAVKIHLGKGSGFQLVSDQDKSAATAAAGVKEKLAQGELHPLHLSFDTAQCVFPLKISSLNRTPSEVQVYVLSRAPLVETKLFEQSLAGHRQWRSDTEAKRRASDEEFKRLISERLTERGVSPAAALRSRSRPENEHPLSDKSWINDQDLLPYGLVTKKELPECSKAIPRLGGQTWWLTRITRTFKPEEMRDLVFEPALPVFADKLASEEGYFVAANLIRLRDEAAPTLLAALQHTNPAVRIHAASVMEQMFNEPEPVGVTDDQNTTPPTRITLRKPYQGLTELLPALLQDPAPEVRMYAPYVVANCWKESLVEPLITLLSDEYEEVRSPAVSCLGRHPETVTNHVPRLRQMLKEGNPGTQSAAMKTLFILKVQLSREELLSALKVPRMDVVSMAMYYLGRDSLTLQEAAILLQNTDAGPRMVGLATLRRNATKDAVGLALPLLKDPDEMVRSRAHQFLTDISGQTLPADQPAAWEKWWQENQATFVPKPMPQRGRPGSRLNRDTPTPETPPPAPQP